MFRILLVVICVVGLSGLLGADSVIGAAGRSDVTPVSTGGAVSAPNPAADAAGEEAEGFGSSGMIMLVLMLGFMYFVLIRPQSKEQKRRKNMMTEIKVGDDVVTIGGMHGVIERKGEEDVDVKVKDGTIITFNLAAVSQVVVDGEKASGKE